jgi:hypothetical protein
MLARKASMLTVTLAMLAACSSDGLSSTNAPCALPLRPRVVYSWVAAGRCLYDGSRMSLTVNGDLVSASLVASGGPAWTCTTADGIGFACDVSGSPHVAVAFSCPSHVTMTVGEFSCGSLLQ